MKSEKMMEDASIGQFLALLLLLLLLGISPLRSAPAFTTVSTSLITPLPYSLPLNHLRFVLSLSLSLSPSLLL